MAGGNAGQQERWMQTSESLVSNAVWVLLVMVRNRRSDTYQCDFEA